MNNNLKLRSSIRSSLLRFTLWKGTLMAALGASVLLYAGLYMPVDTLNKWGLPMLLVGGGLITLGLLPYRKLKRLEIKPDELMLSETHLQFTSQGKLMITIPLQSIDKTAYLEEGRQYGIGVWLKKPLPRLPSSQQKMQRFGCSLFFPYFSERAYTLLREDSDS